MGDALLGYANLSDVRIFGRPMMLQEGIRVQTAAGIMYQSGRRSLASAPFFAYPTVASVAGGWGRYQTALL